MAALTDETNVQHKEHANIETFPVVGSDVIYRGALVMLNASGYAAPATPTAGSRFLGIATETVDNSSGSNGDLNIEVFVSGRHQIPVTTAVTDVGDKIYAETDNPADCTLESGTPTTNAQLIGRMMGRDSASLVWVDISIGYALQELAT